MRHGNGISVSEHTLSETIIKLQHSNRRYQTSPALCNGTAHFAVNNRLIQRLQAFDESIIDPEVGGAITQSGRNYVYIRVGVACALADSSDFWLLSSQKCAIPCLGRR